MVSILLIFKLINIFVKNLYIFSSKKKYFDLKSQSKSIELNAIKINEFIFGLKLISKLMSIIINELFLNHLI